MPRLSYIAGTAAVVFALAACNTTPVATPAGLAQWYPPGTAQPGRATADQGMARAGDKGHGKATQVSSPRATPDHKGVLPKAAAKPGSGTPAAMGRSDAEQIAFIRLQNRLSDLEEKYQQLWLKYQALEKGLALGLMPPEVKASLSRTLDHTPPAPAGQSAAGRGAAATRAAAQKTAMEASKGLAKGEPDKPAPAAIKAAPAPSLTAGIKQAIALYQKAKYGRALIAFQRLQKQYGPAELNGNDLYWIGLCWYHLKDFSKARESLDVFQTRYPQHNLARKASFYQAKIDLDIGLTKKGVAALESLIQDRASDDVAKLARGEIESLHDDIR